MKLSERLSYKELYTRKDLIEQFGFKDATINTGIFRPKGFDSVLMFITKNKTSDRTPYKDKFDGDDLHCDGQTTGRRDHLIIDSQALGLEILLFYRESKTEHPRAGFRYEGRLRFVESEGKNPRKMHLQRVTDSLVFVENAEEVRRSIWEFNFEAKHFPEITRDLLIHTIYWVFDPLSEMFGPGKFVGYAGMDFLAYKRSRSQSPPDRRFNGNRTQLKLESAIGKSFRFDLQAAQRLTDWGRRLFGDDCFGGRDKSKWRFAEVSPATSTSHHELENDIAAIGNKLAALDVTDEAKEVFVRTEQRLLRRALFGGSKCGFCSICGESFPISLLVAAHIKRRANCSPIERGDLHNIAPMCSLGCDGLFERGYIFIEKDGKIRRNVELETTPWLQGYLEKLVMRPCKSWTPASAIYFAWHAARR